MQSKQKKVKWSRGETASALEERTDTGITEVSVAKMQNIISDIYGNISRRPALKIINYDPFSETPIYIRPEGERELDDLTAKSCVFTIDANSYIIFIKADTFVGFLIQNDKFVRTVTITNSTTASFATSDTEIRTAQYNNYMVVYGLYDVPVVFTLTSNKNIVVDTYAYSAPWIAPNGTKTKVVDRSFLSGLEINKDGNGFNTYTYTDEARTSTIYSWVDTGLTGSIDNIQLEIPAGSIVQMPQISTYMRVEGYDYYQGNFVFRDTLFDGVVNAGGSVPLTGTYAALVPSSGGYAVAKVVNGVPVESSGYSSSSFVVRNSASSTGYSSSASIGTWSNLSNPKVMMFGALLTPVADSSAKDTRITVEYGFVSLKKYYPTAFTFSQQRLYASRWDSLDITTFPKLIPGFAVGSQIGRYNDFKNDYNQENEPLEIDISTAYQEQILYMTDYNGLKIFTDSAEYAYNQDSGAVKQSENGSKPDCQPIVFGSTLLYADKSNKQIRVMQYEFGANLFNSSIINQFTQEDLIFNTITMVGFQDKEHYTGHFLYAIQEPNHIRNTIIGSKEKTHDIAICNLTPQNQAMIWSRWITPKTYKTIPFETEHYYSNIVQNVIELNNKVWFIVKIYGHKSNTEFIGYTLAELDYDATMDFETEVTPDTTRAIIIPAQGDLYAWTTTDQSAYYDTIYTKSEIFTTEDKVYDNREQDLGGNILTTPTGPNTNIGGIDLYAWRLSDFGPDEPIAMYTDVPIPTVGDTIYNTSGRPLEVITRCDYDEETGILTIYTQSIVVTWTNYIRVPTPFTVRINGVTSEYTRHTQSDIFLSSGYVGRTTISVFDGDKYMWDDTVDEHGTLTKPLTNLEHPKIGFKIDAELVSHPMDIGGKTYSTTKRIAKAKMVVRDTEPGAVQINDKYGYMDLDKKIINFYNVTGMKKEVKYVIKNNNGAKFTIESIMFDMEYGTLD